MKVRESFSNAFSILAIAVVMIAIGSIGSTLDWGTMPKARIVRQWTDVSLIEIYAEMQDLNPENLKRVSPQESVKNFKYAWLTREPENIPPEMYKFLHGETLINGGHDYYQKGYAVVLSQDPPDKTFFIPPPVTTTTARL